MRRRARGLLLVAGIALIACGRMSGTVPRLALVEPSEGFKMLKAEASASECEGGWAAWARRATAKEDLIDRALRRLLRSDHEADSIINARIEWTSWTIGVYGRHCVALTGDAVRSIPTVLLPMAGDHHDHGGHGSH